MARRKKSEDQAEVVTDEAAMEHAHSGGGIPEDHPQPEPDVFDAQIAKAAEKAAEHFEQEAHTVEPMTAEEIVRDTAESFQSPEQANGQHHEGNGEHRNGEQHEAANSNNPGPFKDTPGRGWTSRLAHPARYRLSEQKNEHNENVYHLRFELPKGMDKPPPEVLEVLQAHKYFKHGEPNGLAEDARNDPESFRTGLRWRDDRHVQKAWELPADRLGHIVKDSLAADLNQVAERIGSHTR